MKILTLISGGDVGGAKTHVLTLLRELGKSAQVILVCFMEGEFSHDARAMGIDTRVMGGKNIPKVLKNLEKLIRDEGCQLIHSHGSRGNCMAWLLKKRAGLPLLSTVHSDTRLDYMGRPLAGLVYGTLNRMALRRMDFLTGVSDAMAGQLIARGLPADRVYTIYNGVDFDLPRSACSREEFFARYGIPVEEGCVYAGIAARLNPVKDVGTLIRAFAKARQRSPMLRLLIAGDGAEGEALRALASELGVAEDVHFLGWVSDTDSFYAALDINTLSSLSETFPYALTEGARWSLATVSSRVGGVPRLIDHGVSGLLFEPGDQDTLAGHLSRLAEDADLRRNLAESLYEKTLREFSLSATVETQLEIYRSVLRRWQRRGGKRDAVAVCGAYGRGNAGDEAILEAILAEIREVDPDIPVYVVSRNPKETRMRYRVRAVHTFHVFAFDRVARKVKLYLNGGGSLIQDVTSRRSLWFYLYTLMSAHRHGAKVVMYGCGIGPVQYPTDRKLAARVIDRCVDAITLREDSSLRELESMGVRKPEIIPAADPSLTLRSASPQRTDSAMLSAGIPPQGQYVCFALRPWPGFEEKAAAFAQAAEILYREAGLTAVFLSIDHVKDGAAADAVCRNMSTPYYRLGDLDSPELITGVLSRMQAVVSMRLHGLIFSAGHGVPLVGVVYDPKVRAFLRYIGQQRDLDLAEVEARALTELVQAARAETSPAEQQAAVARLRALDMENRRILRKFLA